jgi:hypothetical protein
LISVSYWQKSIIYIREFIIPLQQQNKSKLKANDKNEESIPVVLVYDARWAAVCTGADSR